MKRVRTYLLIAFSVVVLLIAAGYIYIARPVNDGRTPAERRQIADACFAMLRSSLTNGIFWEFSGWVEAERQEAFRVKTSGRA
jgi:5-carboxymethyl-2-hydroxymuconate isomerase